MRSTIPVLHYQCIVTAIKLEYISCTSLDEIFMRSLVFPSLNSNIFSLFSDELRARLEGLQGNPLLSFFELES